MDMLSMAKWKSCNVMRPLAVGTTVSTRRFMLPSGVRSSCRINSPSLDGQRFPKTSGFEGLTVGSTMEARYSGRYWGMASSVGIGKPLSLLVPSASFIDTSSEKTEL